jgi:hypothetical protein
MNVITTWMYTSPPGEHIWHNLAASTSALRIQEYYWRCIFLLFESSARLDPADRRILFVNRRPPRQIDGIDLDALLQQYAIEVVELPTITKSPPDYYGGWNTQFIVLDVLDWLARHTDPSDAVLVLDGDVVLNRPIGDTVARDLRNHPALLYTIDYPLDYVINGLTRGELLEIARELDPSFPAAEFLYSGGEFVCCRGSELERLARSARRAFEACLARHARGLKKLNEEAHLLSFVYQELGYVSHTANRYIKRIWTDRSVYSNVVGSEGELLLWHLPAEKKRGFVRLFRTYGRTPRGYELDLRGLPERLGVVETPLRWARSRIARAARGGRRAAALLVGRER